MKLIAIRNHENPTFIHHIQPCDSAFWSPICPVSLFLTWGLRRGLFAFPTLQENLDYACSALDNQFQWREGAKDLPLFPGYGLQSAKVRVEGICTPNYRYVYEEESLFYEQALSFMKGMFVMAGFSGRVVTHMIRRGAAKDLLRLPTKSLKRPIEGIAYALGHSRSSFQTTDNYIGKDIQSFGKMKMSLPAPDPRVENINISEDFSSEKDHITRAQVIQSSLHKGQPPMDSGWEKRKRRRALPETPSNTTSSPAQSSTSAGAQLQQSQPSQPLFSTIEGQPTTTNLTRSQRPRVPLQQLSTNVLAGPSQSSPIITSSSSPLLNNLIDPRLGLQEYDPGAVSFEDLESRINEERFDGLSNVADNLLDLIHSNDNTDISQGLTSDLQYNQGAEDNHQDTLYSSIPDEFRAIAEASQIEEDGVILQENTDPLSQHGEAFISWLSRINIVRIKDFRAKSINDEDIKKKRLVSGNSRDRPYPFVYHCPYTGCSYSVIHERDLPHHQSMCKFRPGYEAKPLAKATIQIQANQAENPFSAKCPRDNCEWVFSQNNIVRWNKHMLQHDWEATRKCGDSVIWGCDPEAVYKDLTLWSRHLLTHGRLGNVAIDLKCPIKDCPNPEYIFRTREILRVHVRKTHPGTSTKQLETMLLATSSLKSPIGRSVYFAEGVTFKEAAISAARQVADAVFEDPEIDWDLVSDMPMMQE